MKKNFLFGVLALAGLLSSCSHDDTADALQNNESDRVTLTATLPADFATIGTRALPTPPDDHKLRCILEVWTQDETPVLKFRDEQAMTSGDNVQFNFTIDQGTYDCLFWADYIPTTQQEQSMHTPNEYTHYFDKYYSTNNKLGLKAISLIANKYAEGFNTTVRDAFFGHYKLEKKVASVENPPIDPLTRPLAKLTIKEKNADNYDLCTGMAATYSVPTGFNVLTGTVNTENHLNVTCADFMGNSSTREIFTDYILTDASSTFGQIAMTFTGKSGTTFQKIDIPAGIPLKRNHKTNATGTLLREEPKPTNDVQLTLEISDVWETPDEEKDVDPKVGDYYYKNGTWSPDLNTTTENPVIGVVWKVNADGKTGSVVSLNERTDLAWAVDGHLKATGATDLNDGKGNTDKVFAYINSTADETLANFPIFEACQKQRDDTGNNGWYIPAKYNELARVAELLEQINAKITAAGGIKFAVSTGAGLYWTSWEDEDIRAFVQETGTQASSIGKANKYKVRFWLDF